MTKSLTVKMDDWLACKIKVGGGGGGGGIINQRLQILNQKKSLCY